MNTTCQTLATWSHGSRRSGRCPAGEHGPVDGEVLVDHCCPVELSDGALPDRLAVECARSCLLGETFTAAEAHTLGMFHELAPPDELVERAVAVAGMTPPDCLGQYTFTKRACQAATLRDIAGLADPLDDELPDG